MVELVAEIVMIGQEQEPEVGYKCRMVHEVEVERCDEGTMEVTNRFIAGIPLMAAQNTCYTCDLDSTGNARSWHALDVRPKSDSWVSSINVNGGYILSSMPSLPPLRTRCIGCLPETGPRLRSL